MDLMNGQSSSVNIAATASEKSSSSESLSDKGSAELKKSFDAVVFDVLKVTPEEYAGQITLMDVPVFKAIQPEELASCGWNKKEKYSSAPNAVAFTRRFNHVSFWVVREILHAQTLKIRAEVLSHYIKTAKKLYELNNLHALMAVVSGLQSAPIFRLTKTWALLSRKDKATFEKLEYVMSKEDNYKRLRDYISSLKMTPCIPYLGSEVGASPQSGRKNAAAEGALLPPTPPSPRNLIPHGHRKCHSLGYNFIHKMNTAEFKSATFPNAGPRHLLDDSVMEPHVPSRGQAESSTLSSGISIGSSDGSELSEETSWPAFERNRLYHSLGPGTRVSRNGYRGHMKASSSLESEDLAVHLYPGAVTIQGVLRRKTLLKEGKKPTVASWTKYWVALCGTQLFYYAAKSLKATERKHFKSTPSKNVSVVGWMVMMADDPEHPDLFLLTDSEKGNSYKFQAGNRMNAMLWFKHLSAACQSNRQQVPANLMTFE
ncbi:ras-specific guanine nucleotide-releasing factor RalGPS2 isoform X4 [Egretta garzetta]|uniref:ras-specific guanine nucleotide-releasing factor RalGPS2 isoform X4 n=1 Tax=Egretta garzetta TaxID=188379 RepID=UPI00163D1E23|nr:ras-specific guanine nucleotide-releasing factor RalGPS2 isoform X4 [Egretta garzetta]